MKTMFYSTVLMLLRLAQVIFADSEKLCLLTLSQEQFIRTCTTQEKKRVLKMVVWSQRMYINLQHWSKRAIDCSVTWPETFSLWPRSSGPFLIEP